jgi:phosphatidylinositol alpha-1,6-mannosyltransferase
LHTALSVAVFCAKSLTLVFREKPDLVYFSHPYPTALIGLATRMFGRPYVVHTHGNELRRQRSFLTDWLRRLVMRKAFRVVCTSNWGKDLVCKMGIDPGRAVVINPKIDPQKFETPPGLDSFKPREGLDQKTVILTVGHLIPDKGQHLVIRALPEIIHRFPNVQYVCAGAGPDAAKLQRLAEELAVADHVAFPGNRDIVSFYHACDIFVLPSMFESFGVVYIEAGACSKPVIGTRAGGIPDAVADGETGLLVEAGDVRAIQLALNKLLQDAALRDRLGRQGYARVMCSFTSDRLAHELQEHIFGPLER